MSYCLSHGTEFRYDYRSGFDLCDECETERESAERAARIVALQVNRGLSARAATITVDAAMYGIGCVEGEIRARIEKEKHDQG